MQERFHKLIFLQGFFSIPMNIIFHFYVTNQTLELVDANVYWVHLFEFFSANSWIAKWYNNTEYRCPKRSVNSWKNNFQSKNISNHEHPPEGDNYFGNFCRLKYGHHLEFCSFIYLSSQSLTLISHDFINGAPCGGIRCSSVIIS